MRAFEVIWGAIWAAIWKVLFISTVVAQQALKSIRLVLLYGPSGLLLYYFGSLVTWRVEAQVLGNMDDDQAMQFKKSVQDECTMVSVAAAILAQIAITSLSLNGLSQAHWIAKGFLVFSLTSALMAVYYATTQQRNLGRLLSAKQVREWIRGRALVKAIGNDQRANPQQELEESFFDDPIDFEGSGLWIELLSSIQGVFQTQNPEPPCEPFDLDLSQVPLLQTAGFLRRKCFTPSVLSVITISAPQMLLSASLLSLLVGFGVYLGFTWTKNLDDLAAPMHSRNVFVMYLVGLGVCTLVYSISRLVQETDIRTEYRILQDHVKEYVTTNKAALETAWHVSDLEICHHGRLRFRQRLPKVVGQDATAPVSASSPQDFTATQPPRPQSLPTISHNTFDATLLSHTLTV